MHATLDSMRALLGLAFCLLSASAFAAPDWAFPINPPSPAAAADNSKLLHIANSRAAFTEAQLGNLFSVPDWHPDSHSPMPDVVAHGRPPDVLACGFCHMPAGQGRPENAALAGLPAAYIIQQVADFKSGARGAAGGKDYLPTKTMIRLAATVSAADLDAAATYFSRQPRIQRTRVMETASVPKMHVAGWLYVADPGSTTEPLGERLLEMTPDLERHERRDDGLRYIAYVPVGSIERGNKLAHSSSVACVACHGDHLQGVGLIPSLVGKSPTYILRQLLAFQTGARASPAGQPMQAVAASLQINSMIDVAAYAASLQP